jgi:hypothetical protein
MVTKLGLTSESILLIYVCFFFGCGMAIFIVRERMVAQANQQLPEDEKIRRTMWSRSGLAGGEMSRLWRAHRQFFPDSSLRFWYIALWALALSWMFFGLTLLQR